MKKKLSIIIPTLNEEQGLESLLGYIKSALRYPERTEIIISDGGSSDRTTKIATKAGVRVVHCNQRGRSIQMNEGAASSTGEVLYFLHADSYPPNAFDGDIYNALNRDYVCGCYRLRFDDSHRLLNFFSWCTRFNVDFFRFGDQSLFIRKTSFEEIGGFREELIVMEDQEIIRRIRRHSLSFILLKGEVVTSARKYRANGVIRLQTIFTLITILWYLGAGQDVLRDLYSKLIQWR